MKKFTCFLVMLMMLVVLFCGCEIKKENIESNESETANQSNSNTMVAENMLIARADYNGFIEPPDQDSIPADAIHIKTAEQLATIGGTGSSGKYYVLDNDIFLTDEWTPIYNFYGTFDGCGFSVNNLYVLNNNANGAGLFGNIEGATISNLCINIGIEGVNGNNQVGGLVGRISYNSIITNCYTTGDVSGSNDYIGGLVGQVYWESTITNCYATGIVSGSGNYIGGLAGFVYYSTITTSYATGDVAGHSFVGGFAGDVTNNSTIANCYTASDALSSHNYVGGFAGNVYGSAITNSYAIGDISGHSYVGGFVGQATGTAVYRSTFTNCYTTGKISGSDESVGGLVGYTDSTTINNCYFNTETTEQTKAIGTGRYADDGAKGLTTAKMRNKSSYVKYDFDIVWGIESKKNNGYPYLTGQL